MFIFIFTLLAILLELKVVVFLHRFSKEYVLSQEEYPDLEEFYRDYDPPIIPGRYTCVGLACDLTTRLSALEIHYPGLKDAVYQVKRETTILG